MHVKSWSNRLSDGIGMEWTYIVGCYIQYSIYDWISDKTVLTAKLTLMNVICKLSKYPHSTVISPHIFKKVAVLGILCGVILYQAYNYYVILLLVRCLFYYISGWIEIACVRCIMRNAITVAKKDQNILYK